jgi:methylase of polypeptide subunit release factors
MLRRFTFSTPKFLSSSLFSPLPSFPAQQQFLRFCSSTTTIEQEAEQLKELKKRFKLPPEERMRLTRLLYKEFFTEKEGVRADSDIAKKSEIAGMYEARIELNWMIQHARELDLPTEEKFIRQIQMSVLERVDLHKPLSYILGTQPFLGCEIKCQPPLLIPRTETEEWVSWWSTKYMGQCPLSPMRILDLCCGTGCIGAAVLRQFPNVEVVGVDIDPLAVRTTIENYQTACDEAVRVTRRKKLAEEKEEKEEAEKRRKRQLSKEEREKEEEEEALKKSQQTDEDVYKEREKQLLKDIEEEEKAIDESRKQQPRFTVLQSDMFKDLPEDLKGTFDVILCNPPYILPEEYQYQLPRSVRDWEAEIALVGDGRHTSKNLLYFKELRDEANQWLAPTTVAGNQYKGPRLVFELGLQAKIIQKLFEENKAVWPRVDLHLDRFDEPRWCECFYEK